MTEAIAEKSTPTKTKATGIVTDKRYLEHDTGDHHPESAKRLEAIYRMLDETGLRSRLRSIPAKMADTVSLLRVHTPEYIERVRQTAAQPYSSLAPDTPVSSGSYTAARLAAGGLFAAVDAVMENTVANAFVLARPPGHHAERSRAAGYCLFNNTALAAMHAKSRWNLQRILIVDWDLHHGNGTQHFFERDDSVLFFSIHQFLNFPGTGHYTETGRGKGEGFTINIPLPSGYGDGEYAAVLINLLPPVAKSFQPQLIIVSAGFDTLDSDPLGGMKMTPSGFGCMARIVMDVAATVCGGRMVLTLEGGYDVNSVPNGVESVLSELSTASRCRPEEIAEKGNRKKIDYAVSRCRHVHGRFWRALNLGERRTSNIER